MAERRNLLAGLGDNEPEGQGGVDAAVKASAALHGFSVPESPTVDQTTTARRVRRTTGRSVPFSVKLRPDTMEQIYGIANSRDIPLAQVIEEAVNLLHNETR